MSNGTSGRYFIRVILVFSALVLLASCGSSTNPAQNPTLQSIAVSPQEATVAAGLEQQFSATGNYSDGTSRPLSALSWSISDTTVATVDSRGLVTTLKQGTVTVSAAAGSVANTAPLNIGPPVATALDIVPANSSVFIGVSPTTKLSAMLLYSDRSSQDVSDTATWSIANPFTASVDGTGNVTALRRGYTSVGAVSGTFTATAGFAVVAEPRYLYFMSDDGRLTSKADIDSGSGQLRMAGYIQTGANNYASFPCPTTDPWESFLYVGSSVSNGGLSGEIQMYSIDPETGRVTPLIDSPAVQTAPVGCIDFEPTGKFAYAASGTNGSTTLLTYTADPGTGILTLLNSTNLSGVPTRVAVDPIGKYLYLVVFSSNFSTASALGYSIDTSSGALTPIPGATFALTNLAGTFSFHPSGNFLYLANTNGQSIDTYSVDRSTGNLTAAGTISTCINPTTVRFSPDGKEAYTACSMDTAHHSGSASVESFAVGSNGALTHLGSAPSGDGPFDLTTDPSGQFLYLSDVLPYIHVFQVGTDGIAKFVRRFGIPPNPGTTMVALGGASPVKYVPRTAYITSTADNTFSTYAVNTDGTLTPLQSVPTPTPFFSLSLWPWGADIAMASPVPSPNLLAFPVSPATGLPGSGFSFGVATTAGGVAIDPSGQFAFETDSAQGVIYTYGKAGGLWWLITYLGTPPFTTFNAGAGAGPITIDPSGLLVYVANQADNSISAYQYWGTSAELFESKEQFVAPYTDGSPFAIGAVPLSLAIDPNEAFLYVLCGDDTLRVFAIDYASGGHIAQVANVPLTGQPSGLSVEPTGRFVYTSDSTGARAFSVNAKTGALTSVPLNPAITLANITGVYAEPAGRYLYVSTGAAKVPGAVFAYSINLDGTLTPVSPQPVATPTLPSSMVFGDDIR
jgi:6-phosphogluconolactonase (cycloisomerase 2 family)